MCIFTQTASRPLVGSLGVVVTCDAAANMTPKRVSLGERKAEQRDGERKKAIGNNPTQRRRRRVVASLTSRRVSHVYTGRALLVGWPSVEGETAAEAEALTSGGGADHVHNSSFLLR